MKNLNKEKLKSNIEKIAKYDFENNKIFGSAYCVMQDGETLLSKCFGKTSLNSENNITPSTLFRLASMTKPITAVATLILVDRGILSLSDEVSKYLPQFKDIHIISVSDSGDLTDFGKPQKAVTIKALLNHTSGIGSLASKYEKMTEYDKATLDNTIDFFLKNGLDFEPESRQQYSGFGAFDVLTKIIEIVAETDYLTFLKREIFDPCGMKDTTFIPSAEQRTRLVDIHTREDGKNIVSPQSKDFIFYDFPAVHYLGGAGLVSTLNDYTAFAKMLLNGGKTETDIIISETAFKLLKKPTVSEKIMPGNQKWGLGVRVITDDSYPTLPVGSFGWSGAYGSHFWIDPENRIAAIYMKNSLFDGGAGNESAVNFEKAVSESF